MLHDIDLSLLHAKIVVSLKQSDCPIMSVIRDHNTEWHDEVLTERRIQFFGSFFTGESVLGVELEI